MGRGVRFNLNEKTTYLNDYDFKVKRWKIFSKRSLRKSLKFWKNLYNGDLPFLVNFIACVY